MAFAAFDFLGEIKAFYAPFSVIFTNWLSAMAHEAGESRIWSGLHFRSDVEAGTQLGMGVSKAVIEYAEAGGSE